MTETEYTFYIIENFISTVLKRKEKHLKTTKQE